MASIQSRSRAAAKSQVSFGLPISADTFLRTASWCLGWVSHLECDEKAACEDLAMAMLKPDAAGEEKKEELHARGD
ncbi:MAG TPA: hypothetical protein VIX14_11730 [Terriglobales bacterium]